MPLQSFQYAGLISHEIVDFRGPAISTPGLDIRAFVYEIFRASEPTTILSAFLKSQIKNTQYESLVKWYVVANHGEIVPPFATDFAGTDYQVASRLTFSNGQFIAGAVLNPGESLVVDFSDVWTFLIDYYVDIAATAGEDQFTDSVDLITKVPSLNYKGYDVTSYFGAIVTVNGAAHPSLQYNTYNDYVGGDEDILPTQPEQEWGRSAWRKSALVHEISDSRAEFPGDLYNIVAPPTIASDLIGTSESECCTFCRPGFGAGRLLEVIDPTVELAVDASGLASFGSRYDLTLPIVAVSQRFAVAQRDIDSTDLDPDNGTDTFQISQGANTPIITGLGTGSPRYQLIQPPFPSTVTLTRTNVTSGYKFYARTAEGFLAQLCLDFDPSTNTIELHPGNWLVQDQEGTELYTMQRVWTEPPVNAITSTPITSLTVGGGGELVLPLDTSVEIDFGDILNNIGAISFPITFEWTIPANPGRFEWTLAITPTLDGLFPENARSSSGFWTGSDGVGGAEPWARGYFTGTYTVTNDGNEAGETVQFVLADVTNGGVGGDPTTIEAGKYKALLTLYESNALLEPPFPGRRDYAPLESEIVTGDGSLGTPYIVSRNSAVQDLTIASGGGIVDVHFQIENITSEDLQVRLWSDVSTTNPGIGASTNAPGLGENIAVTLYSDAGFTTAISTTSFRAHDGIIYTEAEFTRHREQESPSVRPEPLTDPSYLLVSIGDTASTYAADRKLYIDFMEQYDTSYGAIDLGISGSGTLADPYVVPLALPGTNDFLDMNYNIGDTDDIVYFETLLSYGAETTLDLVTQAPISFGSSQTTIKLYSDSAYTALVASNVGAPYATLSDATLLSGATAYYTVENNTGNTRGGFGITVGAS